MLLNLHCSTVASIFHPELLQFRVFLLYLQISNLYFNSFILFLNKILWQFAIKVIRNILYFIAFGFDNFIFFLRSSETCVK